jgi:hypothetical protein
MQIKEDIVDRPYRFFLGFEGTQVMFLAGNEDNGYPGRQFAIRYTTRNRVI